MTPTGVTGPWSLQDVHRSSASTVVILTHQRERYWEEKLLLSLLAYRASNHENTSVKPNSMVFGRDLRLPCNLLFGAPQTRKNRQQ
jgi:hypothetical protein